MNHIKTVLEALNKQDILDFTQAQNSGSTIGFVAIDYREANDPREFFYGFPYVLNSKGDGWFRKFEGQGNGYGLALKSIKITSTKPIEKGSFKLYKASIEFEDHYEDSIEKGKFWVAIHKQFTLDEVLGYIEKHKHEWTK